ncbi:MAG: M48 family metallopeptidase [Anaerolineae bacterium]|nr:M48 family metallopeptidase [Anaerolineae bacterium]
MRLTGYRVTNESLILTVTLLVLGAVILLLSGPTLFLAPVMVVFMLVVAYYMNQAQHQQLIRTAVPVSEQRSPRLARIFDTCVARLQPGRVRGYVVPSRERNAYTFGISDPKVIVVYSSLLEIMDEDEIAFIIGHELGHVALGHALLNTLIGGMAGVPVSLGVAVVMTFAFRSWNRACEFSSDRAGLLACGSLNKAVTALVKLVAGDVNTQAELQYALAMIDAEDDNPANVLANALSTHPMIIKRINELRKYAATPEYKRLLAQADQQGGRV